MNMGQMMSTDFTLNILIVFFILFFLVSSHVMFLLELQVKLILEPIFFFLCQHFFHAPSFLKFLGSVLIYYGPLLFAGQGVC